MSEELKAPHTHRPWYVGPQGMEKIHIKAPHIHHPQYVPPPEEWKRFTSMLTGPAISRLAHALFRDSRTDGPLDESTAAAELRDAA